MTTTTGRRLRIAYVYRTFNRSGSIPSFFVDRAERLAYDEDVIAVCSAEARMQTDAPLRFKDVEPVTRGSGRVTYAAECASFAWRAAGALRRLRDQVDVIHVVGFAAPKADLVTVNAVRRAELAHYFDHVEPDAWLRRRLASITRPQSLVVRVVERRLFREPYPLCLPETRAIANDLTSYFGVPADAIEVMPAGVDTQRFRPDPAARLRLRAEQGLDEGRLVVLFVGDQFRRKGLDRAIAALAKAHVDAELWVAGRDDPASYRAAAESLGVRDRVRFLGRVSHDDLPGLYAAADVLLLPSRQDAWGMPVLEALACGTVAITSEYTGAHEILEHGVNGFVVDEAGRPDQIASILDESVGTLEARARIGERGVVTAARFDRAHLYERLRALHHEAYARRLHGRGLPAPSSIGSQA
ncbi:MAG: glycosyltransferase family 4 protein [Actinomycetota bacterium]